MDNARYNLKMYSGLLLFLGLWDVVELIPRGVRIMAMINGAEMTGSSYTIISTIFFVILLVAKIWLGVNGRRYVKSGSQQPPTKLVEMSKLTGYVVMASAALVAIALFAELTKASALLPPAITLVVLNWYKKAAKQCR